MRYLCKEMIIPIVAYGTPVLKQKAKEVEKTHENLKGLIADMFETMENAQGVGLAAPQIGKSIRLFIVDASGFAEDDDEQKYQHLKDFKRVCINPKVISQGGEPWGYEEGCLSIPTVRAEIHRPEEITLQYFDENFKEKTETFSGIAARIVQHEYDHIEGVLFTDKVSALKKKLLKKKLSNVSKGNIKVSYKMKFPLN